MSQELENINLQIASLEAKKNNDVAKIANAQLINKLKVNIEKMQIAIDELSLTQTDV